MLAFYTDSVEEAYKKMKEDEWINEINSYIVDLNGFVDGKLLDEKNILELFELDAYDVYVSYEDVQFSTSRIADSFKKFILEQYKKIKGITTESIQSEHSSYKLTINSFAFNLRYLRECNNLTQEKLSELSEVALETIRNYEYDRRTPSGKILCQLAVFFNVNPTELLGTNIN